MAYTRVHRLMRLIILIHGSSRLNAQKLAETFKTSVRNIYRDIEQLQGAGMPLFFNEETKGYAFRRDFFLRPVEFTIEEAMALTLLGREIGQSDQLPHLNEAGKAMEKIQANLPLSIKEMIDELHPHVSIALARAGNEPTGEVYSLVRQAINNKRALQCEYESQAKKANGDMGKFRFDPYALYFGQRAWYVIGLHHGRKEVRTLKLARFTNCKPSEKPYFIPDDFSLANHFGQAWRMMKSGTLYDIKLHFDPTVAETVADTHWHDSQEVDIHDDDSIEMRFRVDGLDEITWWIMSYGPHCRVLEPPELVNQIKQLHQNAANQYGH